jgi:hypothetical protein
MVTQVGYSVVRRPRGRVKLCAVCIVHMETRSTGFLVDDEDIPTSLPSSIDMTLQVMLMFSINPMIYVLDQLQEHVPSYWNNR